MKTYDFTINDVSKTKTHVIRDFETSLMTVIASCKVSVWFKNKQKKMCDHTINYALTRLIYNNVTQKL